MIFRRSPSSALHQLTSAMIFAIAAFSATEPAARANLPRNDALQLPPPPPPPVTTARREDYNYSLLNSGRYLDGHGYIRTSAIDFPFTSGYASLHLEGAFASITEEGLEQPVKTAGVAPGISLQGALGNKLGLRGDVSASAITGTDAYSALVIGASVTMSYSAGLVYQAYRTERWLLSIGAEFLYQTNIAYSPLTAAANGVVTAGQVNASSFFQSSKEVDVLPEALLAYTITPSVGLILEAGRQLGHNTIAGDSGLYRIGGELSLNLAHLTYLPIGAALFIREDIPVITDSQSTTIYGVGIYDMISRNFNMGVELGSLAAAQSSLSATIQTTYYY